MNKNRVEKPSYRSKLLSLILIMSLTLGLENVKAIEATGGEVTGAGNDGALHQGWLPPGALEAVAPTTDKTWNGSVSSDWHTSANWTPSGVPTSGDNVLIPDASNDPVISGGDAVADNLTINAGAVLDLGDRALTVEGALTNNGTLKQTLDVAAGDATNFVRITNQAGDQTKYYGVDITPVGASGSSVLSRMVDLVLDDGSIEGATGVNDSTSSSQFVWFNQFTPDPGDFPFTLNEIWMLFDDLGGTANIDVGNAIQLLVYEDADGDPTNGATCLAAFDETVQTVYSDTWNVYTLTPPLLINGPGDVLIAAVNRYVVSGVSAVTYPAAYDEDVPQDRSWLGWFTGDPPDPVSLPTDDVLDIYTEGNFAIRGYGTTTATNVITSVTVAVSGNQFCAGRTTGVERCFDITPAAALSATVRFYLSEAERNGLALADLLVLHYDGVWTKEPGPYSSGGAGDAQYVQVQNVDDWALFALDDRVATVYLPIVSKYPSATLDLPAHPR